MFGLVANENNDLPGAFDETDVEPDGWLIRPVHGGLLSVVNYERLLLKQTRIQKIRFPACAPHKDLISICSEPLPAPACRGNVTCSALHIDAIN